MGNYLACSMTPQLRTAHSTRVILPTGEMRQFKEPTKAAELMLECPNYFIVNSRSLQLGRRFAALSADEDLEFGSVYVMFQMRRMRSVVNAADMGKLFMAASNKRMVSTGNGRIRVSPEEEEEEEGLKAEAEAEAEGLKLNLAEFEGFNQQHRMSMSVCRSRKPGLETIHEEPRRDTTI